MKRLLSLTAILLAAIPLGCDGILGIGSDVSCFDDSGVAGGSCSASFQGIPPLPPPPCWNEAGEIQSDEVCARVHEEEAGAGEVGEEEGGVLPGPPALPE